MTNSTMENKSILPLNKYLKPIISVITILALWDIIAAAINDGYFMPSVRETASALVKIVTSGQFIRVLFTAFFRVISGLILGIIFGVIIANIFFNFIKKLFAYFKSTFIENG